MYIRTYICMYSNTCTTVSKNDSFFQRKPCCQHNLEWAIWSCIIQTPGLSDWNVKLAIFVCTYMYACIFVCSLAAVLIWWLLLSTLSPIVQVGLDIETVCNHVLRMGTPSSCVFEFWGCARLRDLPGFNTWELSVMVPGTHCSNRLAEGLPGLNKLLKW
jgi:hypothetical protein